jgi:hypothetical protein
VISIKFWSFPVNSKSVIELSKLIQLQQQPSQAEPELGTAQPQLVFSSLITFLKQLYHPGLSSLGPYTSLDTRPDPFVLVIYLCQACNL